jgi:transglutaminase-like putative cysteine protease
MTMAVAAPPREQQLPRVPDAPPPDLVPTGGADSTRQVALRLVCLVALLEIGLVRWYGLLDGESAVAPIAFALAAGGGAALLWFLPRRNPWLVAGAVVAALVVGFGAALLVAGVPLWMLDPRDWGSLAPGISDGINALPGVTVPYQGTGDWLRVVIALGGLLLTVVTAVVAGLRRPGWSLVPLLVLLAVPAIQMGPDHPWLIGAAITVPLALYLMADRLSGRFAGGGAVALLLALGFGMVFGPIVDRDKPAIDVQDLASKLQPEQPDRFDWSHGYGPLDWPRDGTILARVKSTSNQPAYWKAEDLEFFDGTGWRNDIGFGSPIPVAVGVHDHPEWKMDVRVSIGDLSTRDFLAPGETLSISRSPRQPVGTRPGGFSVAENEDDLESGNAYRAESYVPRPDAKQLRASGIDYPSYVDRELTMFTPVNGSMGRVYVRFAPFGSNLPSLAVGPGVGATNVEQVLINSGYGRVQELANRLKRGAKTPLDVVVNVERYLQSDRFTYREDVPNHPLPIPAFLFGDHAGYCQHFSGAMALLLRMAGVPARVSSGFAPGQYDSDKGEYVVRDLDAHSWVEVWFNGIGWVTFDPTPTASPARSQSSGTAGALVASGVPGGPQPSGAIGGADVGPTDDGTSLGGGGDHGGFPWLWLVLGALVVAAVAAGPRVWRWWSARRHRDRGQHEEVAELRRALRRTGRPIEAETTLLDLERRFAADPGARDYIRALSRRRYAQDAPGPTHEQRAALRTALARGLGLSGRLRALWALPPRGLH